MPDFLLVPATFADARKLWEWRNEPDARTASLSSESIPYADHERWLAMKLEDSTTRIFVARSPDGEGLGYVRFALDGREAEISIAVDPAHRGRGLGTELIRAGSTAVTAAGAIKRVVARVKASNAASLAAFRHAGFAAVSRDDGVCTLVRERLPGVLFCPDASPERGLGHLQRSLALAAAVERRGAPAFFLAPPDALDWIARFGFGTERLGVGEPAEAAAELGCATVVVDSYEAGYDDLAALREAGLAVVAIDDLARFAFPCDAVVNGGAAAAALPYRSACGGTRFLLGPEYALLRPEFWTCRERELRASVERVLVVAGGSDPTNLLPELVRVADELPGDHEVVALVGPLARNRREVEQAAAACRRQFRLVDAQGSVLGLMRGADLALSAAGGTVTELLAAGTPTVAYRVAENQADNLHALLDVGAVARPDDLSRLMSDQGTREALSVTGRRLVDGRGALRVAAALESLVPERV